MDDSLWILILMGVTIGVVGGIVKGLWTGGQEIKHAYDTSNAMRRHRADEIRTLSEAHSRCWPSSRTCPTTRLPS